MNNYGVKQVSYEFIFKSQDKLAFNIEIDPDTLEQPAPLDDIPNWTQLNEEKCPHCPLDPQQAEHCPLARRLVPVLRSSEQPAFEPVRLRVQRDDTAFEHDSTLQGAYRSLIGLIMATSGCPHTTFFKPMAWFHLPTANNDETLFRVCANFLLFQFFNPDHSQATAGHYTDLKAIYNNIHKVNQYMALRLKRAAKAEHSLNALMIADIFAQSVQPALDESLRELSFLFQNKTIDISFENPT